MPVGGYTNFFPFDAVQPQGQDGNQDFYQVSIELSILNNLTVSAGQRTLLAIEEPVEWLLKIYEQPPDLLLKGSDHLLTMSCSQAVLFNFTCPAWCMRAYHGKDDWHCNLQTPIPEFHPVMTLPLTLNQMTACRKCLTRPESTQPKKF